MSAPSPANSCGCGWRRPLLATLLISVAGVFLVAGTLKAWDPAAFADDLRNYRLFPWPAAVALALYLPWLEISVGIAVLHPRTRRAALWLALALCIGFLATLLQAWARGLDISCGCLGKGTSSGLAEALLRAAALAFATVKLLAYTPRACAPHHSSP